MFEGEAQQICTSASNIFKIDSPVIQVVLIIIIILAISLINFNLNIFY